MKRDRMRHVKGMFFILCLFVLCAMAGGMEAKAAGNYMIKVNKQQNVVTIYKNNGGEYKAYKAFVCSAGYATPTGTFSLGEKMRWHTLDGPSYGQYCSRIYNGFLFHSVWYYQNGQKSSQSYAQYNRLGTTASHGCVRLTVADAKWIYDNCPSGTKVVIYNSSNPGPLGKPRAMKVRGYTGWDPTDPDPANPYRKKKPTIEGAESQKLGYGSKFDVKKGITVKNSNGYDAKALLKIKIMYRMDNNSNYKKVKKVNTKKPGKYKVTYSITDEINHKAKVTVVYKVLTGVQVGSIKLNASRKTLYLGGKKADSQFTLKVKKIKPANATTKKVKYTSSKPAVATVSSKGVVKAKKAGTTTITVTARDGSGISGKCTIKVVQRTTKLKLTAAGNTLTVGNAIQLRATFTPSSVKNRGLKWKSSDKTIATVSASGSVKALKAGTVVITATTKDGSKISATYTLTISYAYAKVVTAIPKVSVTAGTAWTTVVKTKLPATVQIADAYGNKANAAVTWTSTNYKPNSAGNYTASGTIKLPSGWTGKLPVLSAAITVKASAPAPSPSPGPTPGPVTGGGAVIILK